MNEFVQECRREWKRLGVPDPVANEMASELTADLAEAEAEGASAEEVLGYGAFDPRSFAAAWAAERGVIQRPLPSGPGPSRRSRTPAVIATFALVAILGAVLVLVDFTTDPARLALPQPPEVVRVRQIDPVQPPPLIIRPALGGQIFVAGDRAEQGVDTRTVGSIVLIMGLAGIVLGTVWLWVGSDPWVRRRTHIDDGPSKPAY